MPQFDALARALGDDGRDDERQTLDNIMDYAAAAYAAVGDVGHGTPPRFARRALPFNQRIGPGILIEKRINGGKKENALRANGPEA